MIFTFVWAFGLEEEEKYIDRIVEIFEKPSKRDLERSEKVFLYHEEKYRLNSREGKFKRPNYLRIKNDEKTPEEVAKQIMNHFSWKL